MNRTKILAKAVTKPPQQPIQTTLERHSISRELSEKLTQQTPKSLSASPNSNLSSHQLSTILVLPKKTVTTTSSNSARSIRQQLTAIQPRQQQSQAIENISSDSPQLQRWGGVKFSKPKWLEDSQKAVGGLVSGGVDFFTKQLNGGKEEAEAILEGAEREANRVIQAGEAEAKRIMGDTFVSSSQSASKGGFFGKIKAAIAIKAPRIFAKLESNAITPSGSLVQGLFGNIVKKISRAVSRVSKGKISFNSGGKYNARGRAKAVAQAAKNKARRVAALAKLKAKRFLQQRERVAKHLVDSAKIQAQKINQDAKSRSQRMMQRGEYTAAKSLLYKEKQRAELLVSRNNRYAKNILNQAQPLADRIIANGQIAAERIIERGKTDADSIIQDGQRRADDVIRQAQQRAEQIREQGKKDADAATRRRKKNVFQKLAGWVGDRVNDLTNAVTNFIQAAGNLLTKIVTGAVNFLQAVGQEIQQVGQLIVKETKKAWETTKKVLKKAGEVVTIIAKEAFKIVKQVVQTIVDVVVGPFKALRELQQLMRQIGGKVKSVVGKIAKNPLKFGETLINGGKAGFNRFTSQFSTHLRNGIQEYLFGATNIKIPSFDAKGIITMLLQIVGLSRNSVREMAVAKLGEKRVVFAEGFSEAAQEGKMGEFAQEQAQNYAGNVANQVGQTQLPLLAKLFTALSKGGKAIVSFFKELNLSELIKTIVIDGIENFAIETIQEKAIPYAMAKLAASTTPVVGWIMAAIDGLKMANEIFVKRARQVKTLVNSLGDAVTDAASYAEGGVASQLEAGMKKAIPILMSALASYANINDIPNKIKGFIDKGKGWVDENIKPFINKIIDTVGSLIPDLSGKQLASGINKGLGVGNVYHRVRNYLKPGTQKSFETYQDAQKVVDKAQTVFKGVGIDSLSLEPADKTGHTFNVIAAKPLPGRKPFINTNPIRISRPSIANNIYSQKIMRSYEMKLLSRSNNLPLKNYHQFKQNYIASPQRKSSSLTPKKITSRLQTRAVKPKHTITNIAKQNLQLVSKVSQKQVVQKQRQSTISQNSQATVQKPVSKDNQLIPNRAIGQNYLLSILQKQPSNNVGKVTLKTPAKKYGHWGFLTRYVPAFIKGVYDGFIGSFQDLVNIVFDILETIFFEDIEQKAKELWNGVKSLTWEQIKQAIGNTAEKLYEEITSNNPKIAGKAHGKVIGYILGEAALAYITGGASLAAKLVGKIGLKLKPLIKNAFGRKKISIPDPGLANQNYRPKPNKTSSKTKNENEQRIKEDYESERRWNENQVEYYENHLNPKIRERFNTALQFYKKAGFNREESLSHMRGINFNREVSVETVTPNTVLKQYQHPKQKQAGKYFTRFSHKSEIGIEGDWKDTQNRVSEFYIVKEDLKALKSTSADIESWKKPGEKGSGELYYGGGEQYFITTEDLLKLSKTI